MNYYERHLGDYAKDAGHLTMLEHGAYNLLLDRYYTTESAIPADQAHRVARARTDDEKAAVDVVLEEFFTLQDGEWRNERAEEEITKAKARIKAAVENGKRGGRPKLNPEQTQQKPSGLLSGIQDQTQVEALHTPDSIHQTEEEKEGTPGKPSRFDPMKVELPKCISPGAWHEWITYRRKRKLSTNEQTMLAQVAKLSEWSEAGHAPADVIALSISNGWQGLFEPKESPQKKPPAKDQRFHFDTPEYRAEIAAQTEKHRGHYTAEQLAKAHEDF